MSTALALTQQNKHDGFVCVSCAWAKSHPPHVAEFCENGAKATAWDLTSRRIGADFFARHSVAQLEAMSDYALEEAGRLTEPMRWNPASDHYEPVSWEEAFGHIGTELKAMEPGQVVFYTSGRASNEAAYMWQLMARLYGTNNLPDSSNMCHESTSVALPMSLGAPVGTVTLEDFEHTDCILIFGQNTAVNAPRMLHQLDEAAKRDVPIINFNPLRERGLERFTNPQSPSQLLVTGSRQILTADHRLLPGGDMAVLVGIAKLLLEWDDEARAAGRPAVLDWPFIQAHTHGFEDFAELVRGHGWDEIERLSGLPRAEIEGTARSYARAKATMAVYGMGLTQHRAGVQTVRMLASLLLMRGNIGRPGAGICPVRGHSNVQGQRAVYVTEKPELAPLDTMAEMYAFEPPRLKGMDVVESAQAVIDGRAKAVLQLGGNLVRSLPERGLLEPAWRQLKLTVMITTKLNRSHLVHGEVAYLLPCLSRIEIDRQASGPQIVSMEDSTSVIHPSRGIREPASRALLSEPAIIAGLAQAMLPPNPRVDWRGWVADYARVRDEIARTHTEWYADYNRRLMQPGGFLRPNPARKRDWRTVTGRAQFSRPESLFANPDVRMSGGDVLALMTVRSNDQFNTTVYGTDDRFRGINGSRDIVMLNAADIKRLGLKAGDTIGLETAVDDGVERRVSGLRVVPFELPVGCAAGYFPELNPLLPLWHHALEAHVPAAKSIPVRVLTGS